MSRSFGDQVAAQAGVIVTPECREVSLTENDKMIVLASDGVWEFMSNEEVASIVYPYFMIGNAEKAAEVLVKSAFNRWRTKEAYSVDDITCIVIFIQIDK